MILLDQREKRKNQKPSESFSFPLNNIATTLDEQQQNTFISETRS